MPDMNEMNQIGAFIVLKLVQCGLGCEHAVARINDGGDVPRRIFVPSFARSAEADADLEQRHSRFLPSGIPVVVWDGRIYNRSERK